MTALLGVAVLAQTEVQTTAIASLSPTDVQQGKGVEVTVSGTGLEGIQRASISPPDDFTVTLVRADPEEIILQINATCTAEIGKRKLTIGDLIVNAKGTPLYFYGVAGTCAADSIAAAVASEEARTSVSGIYPAGGVEVGKTQQGYITGNKLTEVKSITVVGKDLTATLLPGATDDKLPVEFTASPAASPGTRGLILVLRNGTQIHGYRDPTDTRALGFAVVEARPEVRKEPAVVAPPVENETEAGTEPAPEPRSIPVIEEPPLPPAVCADLELLINGVPIDEVTDEIGGDVTFIIAQGPGVMVRKAWVVSPRLVVQRALNKMLSEIPIEPADGCTKTTKTFVIPPEIPGGPASMVLRVIYLDAELQRHKVDKQVTLMIKKGRWTGSLLTEDAQDALAAKFLGPPTRLNRDITLKDIDPADLEQLGISKADIKAGLALLRKGDTEGAAKLLGTLTKVRGERKIHTNENLKKLKENVQNVINKNKKGSLTIDPDVETRVFELEKDGKKITTSRVTVELPASRSLGSGDLVVYIPKEVATDAEMIAFSEEPEIIEKDPVVKWAFKNVPQDQYREYSFTTSGDAQNFEVVAQAAADKPALLTRFITWIVGILGGA